MKTHKYSRAVMTDCKAVIDLHTRRYAFQSDKDYERSMQEDADELLDFLRDHRSRDSLSIEIESTYKQRCLYCGYEAECDTETGEPYCCTRAIEHWQADQYCALQTKRG